jgi:TolB protein
MLQGKSYYLIVSQMLSIPAKLHIPITCVSVPANQKTPLVLHCENLRAKREPLKGTQSMRKLALVLLLPVIFLTGCQLGPVVPERPPDVKIAFMTNRDGNFDIYLMERDGSNPVNLTDSDTNEGIPVWSAQANALAYLSDDSAEGLTLQQIALDGTNATLLSGDIPVNPSPPAWSPDGQWVAFGSTQPGNAEVFLANAAGTEIINLTNDPASDIFEGWSPDGNSVVFLSDRGGTIAAYAMPAGGGDATVLTDPQVNSGGLAWSPDGSKIAFMSDRDADIEIYVMNADGSNIVRLTESPGFDGFPMWSPNGGTIAFLSSRDGNAEIYTMSSDGSNLANITNTPEAQESTEGDFSWSPDGRQIMFHSADAGDVEIYVVNADGSNRINLSNNPAIDVGSIWVR